MKTLKAKFEQADKVFSKFIRERDSINGVGMCATCDYLGDIRYMDCGHFIGRKAKSTRYDEKNAYLQCKVCNNNGGESAKMAIHINKLHGLGTAKELVRKSKQIKKFTKSELDELINKYNLLNK